MVLTKKQIIGALLVTGAVAIVGIYFAFLRKDTPKPTPTKRPASGTVSGENTDPIIIVGKNGTVTITDKDKFVNSNGQDQDELGCWSLDSDSEWKKKLKDGERCVVTSITLPSDISATAWRANFSWGGLCKNIEVKNTKGELQLANGSTHTFTDPVCGFLFKKVL